MLRSMPSITSERLPRGRHALPRAEVLSTQRRRILRAMIDEVSAVGFAATTAARVYGRAGVSSRAFYENFPSVRECFLAAYEECSAVTAAALHDIPSTAAPLERLDLMLTTYLRLLDAEPAIARTFLLEVYGAGPEALDRRVGVHRQFVELVTTVVSRGRRLSGADVAAVEALVAAVTFAVTIRLAAGDLGDVDKLRRDLVGVAGRLCPWIES
jgi:TetR/AcrR family transcriptional regulator